MNIVLNLKESQLGGVLEVLGKVGGKEKQEEEKEAKEEASEETIW